MPVRDPRRCLPLHLWPDADRTGWLEGCKPSDPFDDVPRYGGTLSQPTQETTAKGYNRWLGFLAQHGWLDPHEPAIGRATLERRWAYFQELQREGLRPGTIIGRFDQLRRALRILHPDKDVAWVVQLGQRSVNARLLKTRRQKLVPDSAVLMRWAVGIMDRADEASSAAHRARDFRDGLLLAMFAISARRLRAMHGLRVGHELVRRGDVYRIELGAELVKTKKPDAFDLPAELTPYIQRYLDEDRQFLLAGRIDDAVWINRHGERLTPKAIQHIVTNRGKARFGYGFGPHAFRHALATTAALRSPETPALAATALGVSAATIEKHYNQAGQVHAARRLTKLVEQQRRELLLEQAG